MTIFAEAGTGTRRRAIERQASLRHYVMTPPRFFAVDYAINPWMDTTTPVDAAVALSQWQRLQDIYLQLGHSVDLVAPIPGLPDMVYAANGGLIIDGTALVARFKYVERQPESAAYGAWLQSQGFDPVYAQHVNEGQGDLLPVGDIILAGHGFRTALRAHSEIAGIFNRRVISLELIDPRFYHLDTALTVLDDTTIAYYPRPSRTCRERIWRLCSPKRSWWTAPTPMRSGSMPSPMGVTWSSRPLPWALPNN